ncbi:hypothetical protein EWM64_g9540 [Hericium alpestre]|uniref:Uncharacterized protein n=1 Tax=Hericium alpestre TaxID=135208 RepID=A0A4Y9ZIH9_9AGAM|nr:hypothetical protein EWM64_g9540 [Hericium alpestre]
MAGSYSSSAFTNYISGIHAWHTIHNLPWPENTPLADAVQRAATAVVPDTSAKPKRLPIRLLHLQLLRSQLDLTTSLDAAVWACATSLFYGVARLGELTTRSLKRKDFNPNKHVTPARVSTDQNRQHESVTVIFIPTTKRDRDGEEIYWAKQDHDSDPEFALANHFRINKPGPREHLFTHTVKNKRRVLSAGCFTARIDRAFQGTDSERFSGHSFRIGGTLEYLLRDVPFEAMKIKGRWSSDAFHLYLRKHAQILCSYMQPRSRVHTAMAEITSTAAAVEADEAAAAEAEAQIQAAADAEALEREKEAELERQEAEKKKPKAARINFATRVPDRLTPRPSAFILQKLRNHEYIELWHFSIEGCKDALANHMLSNQDTWGFETNTSGSVLLRPIGSLQSSKNVVPDANLTWEQMSLAKNCLMKEIRRTGTWSEEHIGDLSNFFVNIECHDTRGDTNGPEVLLQYMAQVRREWHDDLRNPDPNHQAFTIGEINEELLADIHRRYLQEKQAKQIARFDHEFARDREASLCHSRDREHDRRDRDYHNAPPADPTAYAPAAPPSSGTARLRDARVARTVTSSTPGKKSSASTGSVLAVAPPATPAATNAPAAAKDPTARVLAVLRRRSKPCTPYHADAWLRALTDTGLLSKFPLVHNGLSSGFIIGIPKIVHTNAPLNSPSLLEHASEFSRIVNLEFEKGRYLGPFSSSEITSLLGPFQTSPLSLAPKPHNPAKLRLIQNFSHPHSPTPTHSSINSHIDSDDFPCTWSTFTVICLLISRLPPGSQAAVRDVSEAYRTVPLHPSQWAGVVVRLLEELFAIDTNAAFGARPNAGIYGYLQDAGVDILRFKGLGPISKWVDDHIFIRILREHITEYNRHRHELCDHVIANGGQHKTGSRIWYGGNVLPDGRTEEFDEDMTFPVQDLSQTSERSPEDARYSCCMADIDRESEILGIPWQLEKDIPFSNEFQFTGFVWNISARTVALPTTKAEKYLSAIRQWQESRTHDLHEVQKLHGKLLHACAVFPRGRAYLTRLEIMLGNFGTTPFKRITPPNGTQDDIDWWAHALQHESLRRCIPGPVDVLEVNAFSDASSGFGIGIVLGNRWRAWRLIPGWNKNSEQRDIGWAEAIGFELLVLAVLSLHKSRRPEEAFHFKVYGDNRGIVEGWWNGRSRNHAVNSVFRRLHSTLESENAHVYTRYVPSASNPADDPSRGRYPHGQPLLPRFVIPEALRELVFDCTEPVSTAERRARHRNPYPQFNPKRARSTSHERRAALRFDSERRAEEARFERD